MAIYHLSAKPVQRSAGKSAVAAAAYRSRSTLRDERQGMTFSYTAATDLVHAEIVGFDGPRSTLWNLAEAMEKRKDATTAREYEIALPRELSEPAQIELARDFAAWLNETQGCVVDFAIHSGDGQNPHIHMLTTTRAVDEIGTMADIKIPREWSDRKREEHGLPGRKVELTNARERWSVMANTALNRAGIDARIDHRSYADQGIERLPTSHLGPSVSAMEREGVETRAGDHNRMVIGVNLERQFELDNLRNNQAEAKRLEQELANIDAEIEAVRSEPVVVPVTTGTLQVSDRRNDIAERADKEASKFKTGMNASLADQFKARLFQQTWNAEIDPRLLKTLKWVDVDARALTLKTGEQIVDTGNSVSISKGSDDAIEAAIAMAQSKGWKSVRIRGSDDFQVRAAFALEEAGIKPLFRSDIAKDRFSDELRNRNKPEPSVDVRALEDRVLVATMNDPMPKATHGKRDAKVLTNYATRIWSSINDGTAPEVLGKLFVETLRDQARVEGYSDDDLETAQILKYLPDEPAQAARPFDPMPTGTSRRKYYPDAGDKPPGT